MAMSSSRANGWTASRKSKARKGVVGVTERSALFKHADERWEQVRQLQRLGLICDDGEFVPSVHYPPITQYPSQSADKLYETYSMPSDGLLDVYAHFPFCRQHCVFCHYPGMSGPQAQEKDRYISHLKREMEIYLDRFGLDRIKPRSILIGGGTPTYLSPEQLLRFLHFFNEIVDVPLSPQFNYDVDPATIVGPEGRQRLKIMKDHGVTRLTIGVQSLNDAMLKRMNRDHDAQTAVESISNAREFGFGVNIEFIYGHPGESYESWIEVMEKAVELPVDEIQIYRLKVLAYGDFQGDVINRRESRPTFEETMKMKQIAIDILAGHGFAENLRRVYTKSRRHISLYAYNQCCNLYDQVGFGLTGFSSYRDRFALNPFKFSEYYGSIDEGRLPANRGFIRDAEEQLRWSIVLPLKNREIRKAQFKRITGADFADVFQIKVQRLREHGLIKETPHSVELTELGAFVADEVAEQFNSEEFIPFPRSRYANGPLNPYLDNRVWDRGEVSGT
jgi:oxygen-independent coproporphyrinogen-3 oxidase